ncbi:hypothetical protein [Streptomyces beihaiensis]|uniref:Uncharacterized protein n=1 Tax=Streptomyces beihaiensis TaxID=2984495 RepID=A0ABT3TTH9_9ACTN|nr:hypothetical protein [Streptomyces beihaiensis]MCX3060335.1 hypothetical protein [Streptomyces beihaiensis]
MAGHYRTPRSPWGDAALAVFVVFVDAVACLNAALWLFAAHACGAAVTGAYLGLAGLIGVSAAAFFGRAALPLTGAAQVVAAVVLGLGALASHPGG